MFEKMFSKINNINCHDLFDLTYFVKIGKIQPSKNGIMIMTSKEFNVII
jgi:hypothetical protein